MNAVPNADEFTNKSLTFMVFSIMVIADPSKEQSEEFEFNSDTPNPSKLAAEWYRSVGSGKFRFVTATVTAIHANRITEMTCEVMGETATGTVSFKVPELYRGKVQYIANKKDKKWEITELKMPAHNIHIVRDKEGTWREAEVKDE